METRFEKTAVLSGDVYRHFGIHPVTASVYGDKIEDIVVVVMEISEDQSVPELNSKYEKADYWVWYDYDRHILDTLIKEEGYSDMLFAQRFLLDMCFPAGIKGTEEAGQGKAYRVEIIEIKDYKLE